MRNGFKFKNCHSSELGVTVRTKSRPIRPAEKSFTIDLPARDGVYNFSAANPWGREMYDGRVFIVTVNVFADNLFEMQNKLSKISLWLEGSGDLIFDDMPLTVWHARVSDEIIYMPENNGKNAVLEVSFTAEPFGFCIFDTDGPLLGVELIKLDDEIPIGIDEVLTFTVTKTGTLHVLNFGDRNVCPVISITGNPSNISLSLGDKTLSFFSDGNVTADFEKQDVTNDSGRIEVEGEFFELLPGDNEISVTSSATTAINLAVSYTPQYMYNTVLEGVDWGVNDA